MAFSLPDKGEGQSDIQSILFQEYLDVIAAEGTDFVTSGCLVTAQGSPSMVVSIASGVVFSNGTRFAVAGADATHGAADATNPRLDLIVINNAGAIAIRAGTAAAAPKPAVRSANDVVLAVVYIPATDTTISTAQIVDLRMMTPNIVNEKIRLPAITEPGASATDEMYVYARKIAGRMTLKYVGASGVDQSTQDKISENSVMLYLPNNGTAVGLNLGGGWTTSGTVSHPTPSTTAPAVYSQQKRTRWANVATTTNQTLGLRTATAEKRFWRGNAAGLGGFNFHCRFAIGLWPAATVRLFVGLSSLNTAVVAADGATGHVCGFQHDTAEAASVLNFITRNNTTTTKAPITLATNLAAGQCFDAWIWAAPNGSVIHYKLIELNTGTTLVETSTSTTIPSNTTFLGPELMMSNGTANITVTTTAMEVMAFSCQSDN